MTFTIKEQVLKLKDLISLVLINGNQYSSPQDEIELSYSTSANCHIHKLY